MKLGPIEIILLLPLLIIYFVPTIIALVRKKKNRTLIILLNILLGWTFLGWIGALIWACSSDNVPSIIVNNHLDSSSNRSESKPSMDEKLTQLKKLKDLADAGVLSQAEFETQKSKILNS